MSAHPVLGSLRGKPAPSEWYLDRLHRMHSPFVLCWRPGDEELPGRWVLFERSGDPLWRDAGLARRDRYLATEQARSSLSVGIWLAIEQQIDGLHWWGEWPEEGCFSDAWFTAVQQGLIENDEIRWKAVVESNLREKEAQDIWEEAHNNEAYLAKLRASMPELAAQVDEMSRETFAKVCKGAVSRSGYSPRQPVGAL